MRGLTSEFGMVSGGTLSQLPPVHLITVKAEEQNIYIVRNKPIRQLVLVSSTHYCAYTPNLSTL